MVRRMGFRARDLDARLEALRTGFFPQRRGQVRDGWVARLHNRVRHPCGLSAWRKLESISCASSRYGGCFFLHLAAAPVLNLPNWTGEVATSAIAPLRHLSGDQSVGELRDLFGPRARGRSVAELSGPRRSGRIAQPRGDQLRSLQMGCLRQASQTRKAP